MADRLSDREWLAIYEKTIFSVRNLKGELVPFTAHAAGEHPFLKQKRFAIVTAFNPMNRKASAQENRRRNALLKKDIEDKGYDFYPVQGELNEHAEDSFAVENIPEEEALKLGRKYRQHSILYNDEKGVRFIRC